MKWHIKDFDSLLQDAVSERPKRQDFVNGELAWVAYERSVMLEALNEQRKANGMAPVDEATYIAKIENPAVGHSDYSHKIALYCWALSNIEDPEKLHSNSVRVRLSPLP